MIGKTLAHYEIIGLLGKGGMGEVYRAHDPRAGRDVAIKILPMSFASDPERLARFRREARTLASLSHKNIAALYGVEEENGRPFLVMEVAEGTDLAQRIASGPIPLDESIELALQIAEAIEEAHEKGVVHRDLKPANVVVDANGLVKVLDFGLARAYEGGEVKGEDDLVNSPTITAAMTQAGTILGTAAYMSPEQARGRGIDRRSDLWSFGVILWEMLTGERLFAGETVSDTIAGVLKTDPPWDRLPAQTPRGVRRLLERCLERDVRNRLRDIGEARIRLQKWKTDPSSLDESFGSAILPGSKARNLAWLPWSITALAVAMALFVGLRRTESPASRPDKVAMTIRLEDEESMSTDSFEALTISPDGQYILWTTTHGIHLRRRSSLETLFVAANTKVTSAGFSPDSRWIAYSHSGKLYRQSATGGAAIEICEASAGRGLTWVDEETIVMSIDYAAPLLMISVADGSTRPLTELKKDERSHRWPATVEGQREVLFMTQLPGRNYEDSDIEAVSLDDGSRRVIYRGGAFPRYSPTGHLIFARGNTLLAVAYEPGSESAHGVATPVLDGVLTSVGDQELDDGSAQYGFDDQGTLIYRVATSRTIVESRLAWLELESGEVESFGEPGHYTDPKISPDGRHIAVRRGVGSESQIIVQDLDSGAERAITSDRGTKYMGAWSADSDFVYWTQADRGATHFEVRRGPKDGSLPPESIVSHPHSIFVERPTSDGRWLAVTYWLPTESYDVGLIDLEAESPSIEPLLGGASDQGAIRFSPDNRFYLCAEGPTVNADFFIRRYPDTGARWRVQRVNTDVTEFHWAADGRSIYSCSDSGLRNYPVTITGESVVIGQGRLLYELNWLMRADASDVDFHPDGRRALILVPEETPQAQAASRVVWRTGWFDDLRRMTDGG